MDGMVEKMKQNTQKLRKKILLLIFLCGIVFSITTTVCFANPVSDKVTKTNISVRTNFVPKDTGFKIPHDEDRTIPRDLICPNVTDIKKIVIGPDAESIPTSIYMDVDLPNNYILECGTSYIIYGTNFNSDPNKNTILLIPSQTPASLNYDINVDPLGGQENRTENSNSMLEGAKVNSQAGKIITNNPQPPVSYFEQLPDQYGIIRIHPNKVDVADPNKGLMVFHFPNEGYFSSKASATLIVNNSICKSNAVGFSYECNPITGFTKNLSYEGGIKL